MKIVDRKFLQQSPDPQDDTLHPKPLCDFFDCAALVVLGDPGAGKSTSFEQAATEEPDAVYVTIRNFLSLNTNRWKGKTLYLDGLDEQRSKTKDGTATLDELRQRLDELDSPRFRLSCRSADWYGSSDLESLSMVVPSDSITVVCIEPLSDADIVIIASERVSDPSLFLEEAHKRGINELLTNPQTLDLILTVVKTDDWPASRTELFEKACEILLREKNVQHERAHQDKADKKHLFEAAGYLCAVVLCGGLEGVSLSTENSDESFPYIGDLEQNTEVLRLVAQRGLFKGVRPEQRMPLHRTVAEFLAASYLKDRITCDLPIGRVKSIVTGFDGGTLSELRGVYAWLSCLSPQFAASLFPVDPLGIILYGDVGPLAASTKKLLLTNLQSLAKRHPWFLHNSRNTVSFGALACPELVDDFRIILDDPNESPTVKSCVIEAIQNGAPLPELADDLMAIARDSQNVGYIRHDALMAYFKVVPDKISELSNLLDEIHTGVVIDNELYLRGELLRILYPQVLSPTQIVSYVVADNPHLVGGYTYFLSHELVDLTSDFDIPKLIESVIQLGARLQHDYSWGHFVGGLVAKGLNVYGETIEIARLYEWLSITLNDDEFCSEIGDKEKKSIREWLEARPNLMLELLEYCVETSPSDKMYSMEYRFKSMILGDIQSPKFYRWLLNKATTETDQVKADFYFSSAVRIFFAEDENNKPSLDELYEFADKYPQFTNRLTYWLTSEITDWRIKHATRDREKKAEKEKIKADNITIFTSMLDQIRTCQHLGNLNALARHYSGFYVDSDKELSPYQRLVENTNPEIAAAALEGFRAALYRDDIPTPSDIALSRLKNKSFYIGLPLLIGMNIISAEEPYAIFALPEATLKSAIAFHYVERDDKEPSWLNGVNGILGLRQELVADAFHDFWAPQLKARREHVDGIYELYHKSEMAFIASTVTIPLLAEYPNCHDSSLEYLLWAALHHSRLPDLLELTRKVLRQPGTVKGKQRGLWFSTGFVISPEEYGSQLKKFVGSDKDRACSLLKHVTGSMKSYQKGNISALDHTMLGMIIEIVANVIAPFDRTQKTDAYVTNVESASRTIDTLIDKLRGMTEKGAGDVLKHLILLQTLKPWHKYLLHALAIQQQNCREAAFRYPTTKQVIETIRGGKPANLPDLKELVLDRLKTLRDEFRNGPLDGYKDFWNLDSYGRAKEAIPENDCRDRLLGRLKHLLSKQDIQAEPEGHFAEDKRADIKVQFSSLVLPIEIKRHYHKDIWTAPEEQLHKRYSRDPGADGHGIYLVFWFGIDFRKAPKAPSNIKSPVSAAEMEEEIKITIPEAIKDKIDVIVFDCSRPIVPKRKVKKANG